MCLLQGSSGQVLAHKLRPADASADATDFGVDVMTQWIGAGWPKSKQL